MTLAELKTLIQNYVQNSETTFVSTLDDFIINAEERIFELIQLDFFRKNVTGNLTTGNTYLTAPSDFQLSFSLAVIDGNGDYHYLDKKHTSFMREYSPDPTATSERGRPLYYADFDKELADAWEVGAKIRALDNNLQFNIAAFSQRLRDFQSNAFNGTTFVLTNAGEIQIDGLSLTCFMHPHQTCFSHLQAPI